MGIKERTLGMALRQALIMVLGALEDYLEIERSIQPRRKRQEHQYQHRAPKPDGSIGSTIE